jgi:hypothetical protein
MEVVASILSYLVPADDLVGRLATWLAASGVSRDVVASFLESPVAVDLIDRAGESGLDLAREHRPRGAKVARRVDPRKDWSISRIVQVFQIGDDEADRRGLKKLISNQRRKAAARQAEGARVGRPGRPPRQDRPPTDRPVSVRTLQRREKAAAEAELAEKIKAVEQMSRYSALSIVSIEEGEEAPDSPDRVEYRDISFPEVERRPRPPLKPAPVDPPSVVLRTAEARRLAMVAKRLGGKFSPSAGYGRVETWYQFPTVLTGAERAEFEAARWAAQRAEWRREAREAARLANLAKDEAPSPILWPEPVPDAQACPGRVSPSIWAAIDPRHRPAVWRLAPSLFLGGWEADDACIEVVRRVVRSEAVVTLIKETRPDLEEAKVAEIAEATWWLATDEAARRIVSEFDHGDAFFHLR